MKIILIFNLLMIPGVVTSMNVTEYPGSKVTIKCTYGKTYTRNTKYFCRGQKPDTIWIGWCSDLIRTDTKNKLFKDGRFSLYDNTRKLVFTVTIEDLSEQDSGTYQCGVDIYRGKDSYTKVNLIIRSVQKPSPSPSASSSSSTTTLSISLNSQPSTSDFTSDSPSVSNDSSVIIGVSVVLLLIIGIVSCIVTFYKKHQAQAKDPDSASKMSEPGTENSEAVPQMLNIYEEIEATKTHTDCKTAQLPANHSGTVALISVTGYPGGVVNITCKYENYNKENAKYFCKVNKLMCSELIRTETKDEWVHSGRFSLYDNRSAAVLKVTIRDLSLLDSGKYRCVNKPGTYSYTEVNLTVKGSTLIGWSAIPILPFIGLVLAIKDLCKRHPHSASKMPEPGTENTEVVPQTSFICEEIADGRPRTDPDTGTKIDYAIPQLPITPSDSCNTVNTTI
ncbi:hypothetical protein Q8A67_005279 [Cirrhinus molitorella]|uniref:Ig-like domain-containing protein n=1 Tax=Cirrhinus molitorella TaxID=172907 RepID=A0AA88QE72_9TELE|nr:hypothetical protein Q8A67_005279 [Cirrhinus molitorella]